MLEFLRGTASDRKLRLFAVACCYRVSHFIRERRCRRALRVAGRYADGIASETDREDIHWRTHNVWYI
jgi:hypothetical protein